MDGRMFLSSKTLGRVGYKKRKASENFPLFGSQLAGKAGISRHNSLLRIAEAIKARRENPLV